MSGALCPDCPGIGDLRCCHTEKEAEEYAAQRRRELAEREAKRTAARINRGGNRHLRRANAKARRAAFKRSLVSRP